MACGVKEILETQDGLKGVSEICGEQSSECSRIDRNNTPLASAQNVLRACVPCFGSPSCVDMLEDSLRRRMLLNISLKFPIARFQVRGRLNCGLRLRKLEKVACCRRCLSRSYLGHWPHCECCVLPVLFQILYDIDIYPDTLSCKLYPVLCSLALPRVKCLDNSQM
jgi:hypothetical protein